MSRQVEESMHPNQNDGIWQFAVGAREYRKDLVPTVEQIKAAVARESSEKVSGVDKTNRLQATAEMVYLRHTIEEEIVKVYWINGEKGHMALSLR
jgi:hypothetical protein